MSATSPPAPGSSPSPATTAGPRRVDRGDDAGRVVLVRRGLLLNYATLGYNVLEAVASLVAGLLAGSVALVGFGVDSVIEVTASGAAQWRLRADVDPARRERVERLTLRVIGASFLGLAAYVGYDSATTLWRREHPERSVAGIVILTLSVVVMPLLARAKRRVATGLGSRALRGDAAQTTLCAYLSVIALAGVALNALLGWWWADPVAALAMVPIIAREGVEGVRGEVCDDCGSASGCSS
jgi:divalent metal cation (Fe/Co/Zn/Cd) transporter